MQECYILVQGNTVSAMGSFKGLKQGEGGGGTGKDSRRWVIACVRDWGVGVGWVGPLRFCARFVILVTVCPCACVQCERW
jgi:hypothetical protein